MDIEKLNKTIERYEALADVINANNLINEDIEELRQSVKEVEAAYDAVERKYNIEQMTLSKYAAQLNQYRKDHKEHKDLERIVKLWEHYRNALKQLPYILLDKIKPVLERKVNDMLSIVTNFTVTFDMSDNKIDIFLKRSSYRNGQIIINNASGFERFISSLAIRIALLDLSNLPKLNFLAIDEGWSCFDTHNINNVSIIMEFLKTKFDFIITISHLTAIKEHCDKHIYLKRDNAGYSVISYEE
jgi:DNA repair exonuclease SbcCD ATPase subunit